MGGRSTVVVECLEEGGGGGGGGGGAVAGEGHPLSTLDSVMEELLRGVEEGLGAAGKMS